jgi:D-apionolactonase
MSGTDAEERIICFGSAEPEPGALRLTAGALTVELVAGNLRDIRFDGAEVLRAVAYIVRDKDWGTYAPVLSNLKTHQETNAFRVSYDAVCSDPGGCALAYRTTIFGRFDGSLEFDVEAKPVGDFQTNRSGFCILHPIVGVAGSPVVIEHVDGSCERTRLPDLIDPWQPFRSIRAITHGVRPGLQATCRLEGDTFEMEDQRNWSDASYKTYVRPLALPWPYVLADGELLRQSASLSLDSASTTGRAPAPARSEVVEVAIGGAIGSMPGVGLIVTPEETDAVIARRNRLTEVGPQILTCHFDPTVGHGRRALAGFAEIAKRTKAEITLECVVPCRDAVAVELAAISATANQVELRPAAISVSPSVDRQSTPPGSAWPECPPLEDVYAAARSAFPGVRMGGGSFSYFTELNRKRPPVDLLDFVTHATCPLVHAADDRSVMQTLETLPFITRSARAFIGWQKPYRIGPSTIAMRQNPYGSRTFDNPLGKRMTMANSDPRHRGLFGAAWTLGYAARTADAKLEAMTQAALTGPFGLLGEKETVWPIFHVVRALAEMAGRARLSVTSDRPESVQGVAVEGPTGGVSVWLANLTDQLLTVRLSGALDSGAQYLRCLDAESWRAAAAGDPPVSQSLTGGTLLLAPFAIAQINAIP